MKIIAISGAIFLYGLFWLGIVCAFVYLIFKQLENKKKEKFEKRDN